MNVYFLLDRSGSMSTDWVEVIGSVNEYMKKLQPADMIHMAVFDNEYDVIRDCPAEHWADITDADAQPRGMTALYDSCGKIMRQAEEDAVERTILVVMTDGHENASREFTRESIKAKIEDWETNKKWEVVFLGASFDAVESVSSSLGGSMSKTANFSAGNYARGFDALAVSTSAYGVSGQSISFSDDLKNSLSSK
jgi:von Willebrand factor type A domain